MAAMKEQAEAILLHRDGIVISVDEETASLFGYQAAEMIGLALERVFLTPDTQEPNRSTGSGCQLIGIRKDGSRFLLRRVRRRTSTHPPSPGEPDCSRL
jgi:PAS domain S-box-containing protein